MRVVLVVSAFSPAIGGVERHVEQLAAGLAARGDEVTVATHRLRPGAPPVERRDDGVLVRRFPLTVPAANYRFSAALGGYLRASRDRFDVVHVHSYHTLVGLSALLAGAGPLVLTPHYHGTGHTPFRALLHRPYRVLGRRLLERSRAVVCVSRAEALRLAADFPAARDRIVVIPNGTRLPAPSARALAECPAGAGDVASIGRLEHYKRNDLLVEAIARVPAPARLVLVGEGPARTALARQAERLGVGDRVTLTGRLPGDDLAAVLARAGVVASMSEHEAFGLSVADGLAAGARVVASDLPAHREVAALTDRPAVTLVPPGDVARLAGALAGAVAAGRPAHPARLPSWEDVVTRTRAVYTEEGLR